MSASSAGVHHTLGLLCLETAGVAVLAEVFWTAWSLSMSKIYQSELLGTFLSLFPVCRNPTYTLPARGVIALSFEGSLSLHRSEGVYASNP